MALAGGDPDLWKDAAGALFDAGDERWATLVEQAALSGTPVPWIVRLMIAAARRDDDAAALAGALELLRDALRRDPSGNAGHLWSLLDLPDDVVRPMLLEVVAALPFAARPACKLLARWKVPDTAAPLRNALAAAGTEDLPWVHAALGAVTADPGEFDRGWAARPDRFFDEHGYLSAWSTLPRDVLLQTCRAKLTGVVAARPDRDAQLLACRLMLPIDGLAGIWPTLRALVDAADVERHEAIALVIEALRLAPDAARRADLVALLDDIRWTGRSTPFGIDVDAPVEAAVGLHALGAGSAVALAETCLVAMRSLPHLWFQAATPRRACALLAQLAGQDARIRDATRACYAELLAADRRLQFRRGGGRISEDEAFRESLRQANAAI